ncbi:MAG: nitroreductase family protein [Chloroflexi bacterium]|nr:nitroreductase family protein [Chloroflexota bacterium]
MDTMENSSSRSIHWKPSELQQFLRSRRSIRRFKPDPISETVLQEILRTAGSAPSAHNRQPWRMEVVMKDLVKMQLADAMGEEFKKDLECDNVPPDVMNKRINRSRNQIMQVPVVVLLCLDRQELNGFPDESRSKAEYLSATQSVANAGMLLLLAAHAEGVGGVWICSPLFAQDSVRRVLALPDTWDPQAMFLLGYADESPRQKPVKSVGEFVRFVLDDPELVSP